MSQYYAQELAWLLFVTRKNEYSKALAVQLMKYSNIAHQSDRCI